MDKIKKSIINGIILFLKYSKLVTQSNKLKKIDFNIVILLILSFNDKEALLGLLGSELNNSFGFPVSYIFILKNSKYISNKISLILVSFIVLKIL